MSTRYWCILAALVAALLASRRRRARPAGRRADRASPGRGPGLLGPAPPPRAARHLAHLADPLPHRVRLPAVQLCGPGRQPGRLQRRARAADLRGAQAAMHDPAAPLRHAAAGARREPRRRRDRLARGDAGDAPARRFLRPVLPRDRALRRAPRLDRCATPRRRRSRARRSRSCRAPRTSNISKRSSPRPS